MAGIACFPPILHPVLEGFAPSKPMHRALQAVKTFIIRIILFLQSISSIAWKRPRYSTWQASPVSLQFCIQYWRVLLRQNRCTGHCRLSKLLSYVLYYFCNQYHRSHGNDHVIQHGRHRLFPSNSASSTGGFCSVKTDAPGIAGCQNFYHTYYTIFAIHIIDRTETTKRFPP